MLQLIESLASKRDQAEKAIKEEKEESTKNQKKHELEIQEIKDSHQIEKNKLQEQLDSVISVNATVG